MHVPAIRSLAKHLLAVSVTATLAACGGGSDSDDTTSEEHEHEHNGRLLFSLTDDTSLRIFDQEDDSFSMLANDAAGVNAVLTLADNGLSAAVLASGTLNIVNSGLHSEEEEATLDEHEHEAASMLSLSLPQVDRVVATQGHFSVLTLNSSKLLPTDDIEADGLDFEDTTGPASQTYPALMLDEEHGMLLFFAADKASVWEDGTAEGTEFSCTAPSASAQSDEFSMVLCNEGLSYLQVEEENAVHTLTSGTVTLSAAATALTTNGHDFVAWNSTSVWVIEEDDNGVPQAELLTLESGSADICSAAFATEDSETLAVLSSDGYLNLISLEDDSISPVALDQTVTTGLTCDSLRLANGPEGFLVADKNAALLYLIDSHGGPYHVHSRFPDNQLSSAGAMVLMHAIDAGHTHDH